LHETLGVLRLRLAADARVPKVLESALGVALPMAPNAAVGAGPRALATAPGEWVLIDIDAARVEAGLTAAPDLLGHYADLTEGRMGFHVAGEDAARLVAAECPLDLDSLGPDRCAESAFAGMPILVERRAGEPGLRLYVDVSLAAHLAAWFDAVAEELDHEARREDARDW
jgi:sarcosine oxidase subunit gamma